MKLLVDQGRITMGYPVLRASGGKGASAMLTYAEALVGAKGEKGNRNAIKGKAIKGLRDHILFDGGGAADLRQAAELEDAAGRQTEAIYDGKLADAVPASDRKAVMGRILADPSLVRASFYFRFYVDEALRRSGLADRYVERLEPWRSMIRNGMTSTA